MAGRMSSLAAKIRCNRRVFSDPIAVGIGVLKHGCVGVLFVSHNQSTITLQAQVFVSCSCQQKNELCRSGESPDKSRFRQ